MLDEDQVKEVEEHLSTCDSCRKELDEMKEILGLGNQAEMVPIPEAFNFRLKKALKEEKTEYDRLRDFGETIKKEPAVANDHFDCSCICRWCTFFWIVS